MCAYLGEGRILPDEDLVLRVAVRRHQFGRVFGPGQVAHLRARVDVLHRLARQRVPEADAAVGRTAAAGQHAVVVRRPGDRCQQQQQQQNVKTLVPIGGHTISTTDEYL